MNLPETAPPTNARLPVLFVAHGAPLVAIEEERGAPLVAWGRRLPRPQAVLVLSAHWEAPLSLGSTADHASLVYDFGSGLPSSLFAMRWPAPGAPALAARVEALLAHRAPQRSDRGLDHGAWTVLMRLFPDAEVPTLQVSVPRTATEQDLIDIGRELAPLRDEGVLIVGSGNLVHNLSTLDVTDTLPAPAWARAFDEWVRDRVEAFDLEALVAWRQRGPHADVAHPTAEHLRPLFVCLGAGAGGDVSWPLIGFEHGSTSRRSLQLDGPTASDPEQHLLNH